MAWEWVAPVIVGGAGAVGVFFTWFAGAQGRAHAERMVGAAKDEELRVWRLKERRDAYLEILKVVELDLRRRRYQRDGEDRKLAELEQTWPEKLRARMGVEAVVGVQVFGSAGLRELAESWRAAAEKGDYATMVILAEQLRGQVRRELGPREGDGTLPESGPGEAEETGSPPVEAEATRAREVDAETAKARPAATEAALLADTKAAGASDEVEKVKAAAGVSAEEQG
ncbi:hypothetical protein B0I32_111308 [Nonomuraea fuscirosea]|uniref:Uncharacterized protein n=1 Tax=Nonomuraea fuscirosea TaxID=1291556 RepID=A0A2T0MWH9_9ACTN|nr:hypothetical protein [Nonomuraea fuscirosea]PRX63312.1 hypothetical protein B0I32_111308 [Nonomuraea fuscirosea]